MQLRWSGSYHSSFTAFTGLNPKFPSNLNQRNSWLGVWTGGRGIHVEGFAAQTRLDAGQRSQVHEFQVAVIHRAVPELLQEMLEGVSDSETLHPVPFLYVNTVWLWKAWFIAERGIHNKHNTSGKTGHRKSEPFGFLRDVCPGSQYLMLLHRSFTLWCCSFASLHKSNTARPRHSSWVVKGGDNPASLDVKSVLSCKEQNKKNIQMH